MEVITIRVLPPRKRRDHWQVDLAGSEQPSTVTIEEEMRRDAIDSIKYVARRDGWDFNLLGPDRLERWVRNQRPKLLVRSPGSRTAVWRRPVKLTANGPYVVHWKGLHRIIEPAKIVGDDLVFDCVPCVVERVVDSGVDAS